MKLLVEGGNIFEKADSIKRENVMPTINAFLENLISVFPNAKTYIEDYMLLGSTGKKDENGDIDLGYSVDYLKDINAWDITKEELAEEYKVVKGKSYTATKEQILIRSIINVLINKLEGKEFITIERRYSGRGKMHALIDQYSSTGKISEQVQIDIIFGLPEWIKFTYYSEDYPDDLKGLHRTQLLHAMFSVKGYVFDHIYGVKDEKTDKILATTPDEAISLLENIYGVEFNEDILSAYHKLQPYLEQNLDKGDYRDIIDNYIGILINTTDAIIPDNIKKYVRDAEYK